MSALLLALLLCGDAAAHCGHCGAGAGGGQDDTVHGQGKRAAAADRKAAFTERADILKDEGSKVYEPPPGASATPMPPEGPGGAPPVAEAPATLSPLSPEDAADNMKTVLSSRLARTSGLWSVRDARTGKPRGLALQGVSDAKDEGQGRWSARAVFGDKAGTVRARLLVDLSGERWRVLTLAPEAPPAASPKAPAAR